MSNPIYLVASASSTVPLWTSEIHYTPPGVDEFVRLGELNKIHRRKHGARIWACKQHWNLHGSGYPQSVPAKWPTLRRATDEDAAKLEEIMGKISALREEHAELLRQAWRNGSTPHASEAVNYPSTIDPETQE